MIFYAPHCHLSWYLEQLITDNPWSPVSQPPLPLPPPQPKPLTVVVSLMKLWLLYKIHYY